MIPYEEWLTTIPAAIRNDALWKMQVYRFALYLSDLALEDTYVIIKTRHLSSLADQLYRATSSIDANISEGYSCPTAAEQARFYVYALRSARESRGWYFKARTLIGDDVMNDRVARLEELIRMLTKLVTSRRGYGMKEASGVYGVDE